MTWLTQKLGWLVFWACYPVFWLYLNNSKRTRVLVIVDNQILLLQGWLGTGKWSLPGGGLHKDELPVAGALRELKEETGILVGKRQLKPLYQGASREHGIHFSFTSFVVELPKLPAIKKQWYEVSKTTWLPLKDVTKINASADTHQAAQAWLKAKNLL